MRGNPRPLPPCSWPARGGAKARTRGCGFPGRPRRPRAPGPSHRCWNAAHLTELRRRRALSIRPSTRSFADGAPSRAITVLSRERVDREWCSSSTRSAARPVRPGDFAWCCRDHARCCWRRTPTVVRARLGFSCRYDLPTAPARHPRRDYSFARLNSEAGSASTGAWCCTGRSGLTPPRGLHPSRLAEGTARRSFGPRLLEAPIPRCSSPRSTPPRRVEATVGRAGARC